LEQTESSLVKPGSIQKVVRKCNPNNSRCIKGTWVTDIPTFEKKHFLLQNNDILKRIWKVVGGDDFSDSYPEKYEPFFLKEGHSENILDPNEDWDR
jgi:hypothetical protein